MNATAENTLDVLQNLFGFNSFQGKQLEAITAVLSGHDVFVLMPTGGGKSLCYSLPALMRPGIGLVVSPLIALMENQVANLQKKSIKCDFLSSTKSAQERSSILQDIKSAVPTIRLLFITPELLSTEGFMGTLKAMNSKGTLSLFAVDEAHCISSWGHDFRPAYRKLGMIRQQLPGVPIMALTATAAPQVQNDIVKQLRMHNAVKLVSSFNRPNIHYSVKVVTEAQPEPMPHIVALLKEGRRADANGAWPCSIIYALKKETTEEVAMALSSKGIPCQAYHAGRPAKERSRVLEDWNEGRVPVVAATIAFGMGIDRANVRLVVNYSLPKTLEGFYQESGRAGRDGKPARSVVFYSLSDRDRMDWILAKQKKGNSKKRKADDSEQGNAAAVAAFSQVVAYCVTETCRRALVLGHFGEALPWGSCSGCDCCEDPDAVKAQLHQLDSEVLQHAQQKAERRGGTKSSRVAHRSEADPFADAAPSGQYENLPSGSENDEVASASQRLAKLLQNKGKPKQAPQQSQPQTAPAITAAMRQHASQRVTKALQANSSLGLESTQAEAETGASRWESDIFSSSNSKSAYLSKLSNAVSQIRRATDLAQLELPAAAWVPDQATAAARLLGPNMADMANQPLAAGQPSDRVGSSLHAPASDLQSTPVHTPSGPKQLLIVPSPPLQPASGSQLHELMQELKRDSSPTSTLVALQQMKQLHVTQQLLMDTGAGKAVKAYSKSSSADISEAAKAVVRAWKRCILRT